MKSIKLICGAALLASTIAVPALAQDAMKSGAMMSSGSGMKMSKSMKMKMDHCQSMDHDMMMKNKSCMKMMKMHPDMMKGG